MTRSLVPGLPYSKFFAGLHFLMVTIIIEHKMAFMEARNLKLSSNLLLLFQPRGQSRWKEVDAGKLIKSSELVISV